MNIDDLYTKGAAEDGAEMRVFSPITNQPTDVYITIKGVDSDEYRQRSAQLRQDIITSRMTGNQFNEAAAEREILLALTTGWRGLEHNGEPFEFTPERCRELYTNAPYICDQLDQFIARRVNFLKV